ncbi:alpha-E domain-containing protein [Iamia majanohamensis]|uniref:Alpha-E domain-containing protein n=1 Tax=Iamia majanohamensis TaxID=467976 RepID=A0AAE9Y829_9ACTN|nr:alpha-E domain-containing protein [Iamia majanohamensis]WCO66178.1 alpha-E domain-containing protein [Iamia majanohamensis]
MLSRIAESLYWMGRYVERADDTARLLDVHVHRMLADATDERMGSTLIAAMGLAGSAEVSDVDLWRATELLAYDQDNPSSVAGSLRLARENARGLRETLATDVWEAINRTHHDLDAQVRAARALGPNLFFRWVGERVALLGGLIDSVVLHDDGWRFLTAGRCLERVDMTARLLAAVTTDDDASRWTSVLESCGANDAFLRTHGGEVTRERALAFLLQSEDLPRSVVFALRRAENCLAEIAVANGSPGRSVRVVGRARSELTYASAPDLVARADEVVEGLQRACQEVDELVRGRYFRRADLIEWASDIQGVGA